MTTYCPTCEKSAELVQGEGTVYANNAMAFEVKGRLACGHAARPFVTSWQQWSEWEALHRVGTPR